jgi:hypothetical protein
MVERIRDEPEEALMNTIEDHFEQPSMDVCQGSCGRAFPSDDEILDGDWEMCPECLQLKKDNDIEEGYAAMDERNERQRGCSEFDEWDELRAADNAMRYRDVMAEVRKYQ